MVSDCSLLITGSGRHNYGLWGDTITVYVSVGKGYRPVNSNQAVTAIIVHQT